jgi:hypothetical protein
MKDAVASRIIILTNVTFGGQPIDAPGVVVYLREEIPTSGESGATSWRAQASFVPAGPFPRTGELRGIAANGNVISGAAIAEMNLTRNPSAGFIDVDFIGDGTLNGHDGASDPVAVE